MTFLADTPEISARFRPATAAERRPPVESPSRFVAPGSVTNGQYGLFEYDVKPRGGPLPHFHRTFSEAFYILEGTVALYDGSGWVDAVVGDFLYVPHGGIHAFRNDDDTVARMLILFAPGIPRERFFTEIAEIHASGRTLSPEEWMEFYARHDQYMV
jgi:mannose-6-phosphate isomerase-like protein (cupin superfamily)